MLACVLISNSAQVCWVSRTVGPTLAGLVLKIVQPSTVLNWVPLSTVLKPVPLSAHRTLVEHNEVGGSVNSAALGVHQSHLYLLQVVFPGPDVAAGQGPSAFDTVACEIIHFPYCVALPGI
jgi:hypothetical protein